MIIKIVNLIQISKDEQIINPKDFEILQRQLQKRYGKVADQHCLLGIMTYSFSQAC